MLLTETRLSPTHESDLYWLFNEADGEMGLRSSSGPQLDRLREGRVSARQSGTPDLPLEAYFAADKEAPIRRALAAIHDRHQRTLRAALGPPVPLAREEPWSGLGTVAVSTTLVMLTASRQGIGLNRLRKMLTPPAQKPDEPDATAADKLAARVAHGQATAAWRVIATKQLDDLRRDARTALLAASLAYETAATADQEARAHERVRFPGDEAHRTRSHAPPRLRPARDHQP